MSNPQPEIAGTSWHSFPKVYALGHRYVKDLLLEEVTIEEKIDGSQFSFGLFADGLHARSKGQQLVIDAPEKMFTKAIKTVLTLQSLLIPGWTYRAEYLKTPKHNTLAYDRIPASHLIIFDINTSEETYLDYPAKAAEAARLGLDVVPLLYYGMISKQEELIALLDRTSILGGQQIEGFVIKNYDRFGEDGKALMGKFVREDFKELNSKEWRATNPTNGDVIGHLIQTLRTPARWDKAVQHLRDAGRLTDSPVDIGALMKEVQKDTLEECQELITKRLLQWANPKINRGIIAGLPEWYKEKLLQNQFTTEVVTDEQPATDSGQ